jgi:signal transduction histidine kinase
VLHIVDTLLDNAANHGAGTVAVCARAAHRALTIEVTDEGGGITGDPELIFQRRHRTGSDGERTSPQGPGIGLALARRLAEAEGGRLVLSVARPCPRFSLFLPIPGDANTPLA